MNNFEDTQDIEPVQASGEEVSNRSSTTTNAIVATLLCVTALAVALFLVLGDKTPDDPVTVAGSATTQPPETTMATALQIAPTTVVATTAPAPPAPTTAVPATVSSTSAPATTIAPTTTATPTTMTPQPDTTLPRQEPPVISVPASESLTFSTLDVLLGSPDVSQFAAIIEAAHLEKFFDEAEPLTVLVPSNSAFDQTDPDTLAELLSNPEAFLLAHAIDRQINAADLLLMTEIETMQGALYAIDATSQTVGGSHLVVTDVETANGFIHVIDLALTSASDIS